MKLLKEPLLHFLIAGALIFVCYSWLYNGAPSSQPEDPIRIGKGELRWLRETFANQWRREPTGKELNDLLSTYLNEELLAREARTLGLDQNDTVIRRRLAQKLTFLVEDTSRIADPSEDELQRFYAAHAESYRTEPQVSFTHVFFSPEQRTHAEADARAALTMVSASGSQGGKPLEGDPLLLESVLTDIDFQGVSSLFGSEFARAVFALPIGSWSGPVRSAFGIHLVLVTHRVQAEARPFNEVRDTVLLDWRRLRESEAKEAYLGKLRDKYGVVIDDRVKPLPELASKRETTP